MTSFCFAFILLGILVYPSQGLSIFPGTPYWADTSGVPIQAHGGGFLLHNSTYYWFGEDKTFGGHLFHYVNCYESTDLVSWSLRGHALSPSDDPSSELSAEAVVERPKVIYNERSSKFVMWFHLDSSNYGLAKLGVAISDKVEGPYEYLYSISPFGDDSRDMTVWVDEEDPDKTAYLVYATRVNLDTVIATLSTDYLDVGEKICFLEGIHREAYAVFRRRGLYYIVMSRATGWDPNPNEYMYSLNMSGPWSDRFPLAPGSSNTFESQANYVIPVGGNGGGFIYAGDRWNRYDLSDSRYLWLPIDFSDNGNGNSMSINWSPQFSVDVGTGVMLNSSSNSYDARSPEAELVGNSTLLPCSGCENGEAVGYIGLGGKLLLRGVHGAGGSGGGRLHSVLISYTNGDSTWRYGTLKVTSGGIMVTSKNLTFPKSGGGQVTKQLVVQVPLEPGRVNDLEIGNDEGGYGPDIDYVRVECVQNDSCH